MGRSALRGLVRHGGVVLFCGALSALTPDQIAGAELPLIAWEGRTMGSPYTVKLVGAELTEAQVAQLQDEIEARLREVNRQMSHYRPDSELSAFNRWAGSGPFQVSSEFARVVRFTLEVCRQSDGALDPTLSPVVNLWGFGERTEERRVPSPAELAEALGHTGWRKVWVTDGNALVKSDPALSLNLSAVAKGFGVDEMIRLLQRRGFTNLYASIAGEVRVTGHNAQGEPWRIAISAPVEHWSEADPIATGVRLSNQALSTSGDYQKFFRDAQGRRLCHILDPATGWPVQHNVGGVSVVAPESMTADALATTLFVLGPERGVRWIESWTNAAALFIVREPAGKFRMLPSNRFAALTGFRP